MMVLKLGLMLKIPYVNGLELNVQYGWESGFYVATNLTLTDSESTFKFNDTETFSTPLESWQIKPQLTRIR